MTEEDVAEVGQEEDRGIPREDVPEGLGAFQKTASQFAESAMALTAASIRMQMILLDEARAGMDELVEVFGGEVSDSTEGDDRGT